jgi:hypothetical protein
MDREDEVPPVDVAELKAVSGNLREKSHHHATEVYSGRVADTVINHVVASTRAMGREGTLVDWIADP